MRAQPNGAPAPLGWSSAMRRWLRLADSQTQPQFHAGLAVQTDAQGGFVVHAGSIKAVSIADIAEVQSHEVFRVVGSISHVVRFVGGGELRYAFNGRGQVIALSATGVRSEVSPQRVLIFGALTRR